MASLGCEGSRRERAAWPVGLGEDTALESSKDEARERDRSRNRGRDCGDQDCHRVTSPFLPSPLH